MNLSDEIKRFFGDLSEQNCFHIYGKNGGYFEGVKSILSFNEETVLLLLKKSTLEIVGEKLSISKYSCGDVAVLGNIFSVVIK